MSITDPYKSVSDWWMKHDEDLYNGRSIDDHKVWTSGPLQSPLKPIPSSIEKVKIPDVSKKIQEIFEREKLKNALLTEPIQMFSFPSELAEFIFSTPVNEKISEFVWKLPKGSPVSPVAIARTELFINNVQNETTYYGELMEEVPARDDFLCKGIRIFKAHEELFSGLRDYRGRVPATSNKPILVKLDKFIDTTTPRPAHKAVAVGFLTSFSFLEKTDKVWLPPQASDGE